MTCITGRIAGTIEASRRPLERPRDMAREGLAPMQEVPYGFCHCGCGQRTAVADDNDASQGRVKGEPMRYVRFHNPKPRKTGAELASAFWSRLAHKPTGCWEWTGTCMRFGYGSAYHPISRKKRAAHRIAYELAFGPIPDGLFVCHHCDNPPCCNPAHLFLGTASDNHQDKLRKGRGASGYAQPKRRTISDGTGCLVLEAIKGASQADVAREFGISQQSVSLIACGAGRWASLHATEAGEQ